MSSFNDVLAGYGTTVFEAMTRLANAHSAINLGQGFPDTDGPDALKDAAERAMREMPNQYPPMMGLPALRQAVAAHNARFYGLDVDWESEVIVTSGATEALADCMLAFLNPGDEVVVLEPVYDAYAPIIRRAGGVPRPIRLQPPAFELTDAMLDEAFGPNTAMLLLNDPQNPAGKVYTADEIGRLAERVIRSDAIAVCDEAYEHIVFDDRPHIPLMTLPGMRERCVRIGSAGKTFSMTGWKVGYASGDRALMAVLAKAHQFVTFTVPPMLQAAVAEGLGFADGYFVDLAATQAAKRDRLAAGLQAAGLAVTPPGGTYFVNAGIEGVGKEGDEAFCRDVIEHGGVAALPLSAFYLPGNDATVPRDFVRFCFCKGDAVLDEAAARLAAYLGARV
ncbi:MAG: aminotransferase [Rhodospirillales bacterium]